ncbi:MAG: ArsR family transcriptional regulator [Halobacteriales archaeon SW_9_67_24]|jgi:predicted DNA-binding transcriptional regulator AlpA|nr:MAG: ArsR family transcriptional regulator [Halobacteriales archaeon SW_9_67_24]
MYEMSTVGPDNSEQEAAAEDTVLTDVLGPHAKVRILAAFLGENDRDLNATEVSRLAGIDRSTFYEHIDDLLDYRLVEKTRTIGNSTMYRINRDNAAAEDLAQLEWDLLDHVSE